MPVPKHKIIFLGTPSFALAALLSLIDHPAFEVAAVITRPDKPVGREQKTQAPPVKLLAEKYHISVLQPVKIKEPEWLDKIKTLAPDLLIVAAYGQIIPQSILDIPRYGSLNIHASLLPKYRGASPINYAILNGDKETGVTIMLIDAEMDHGPIISYEKIPIEDSDTSASLNDKLSKIGAELLIKTLPEWINKKITARPQDDAAATYTKILTREDGKIDWTKPAEEIERQVRAFHPWPGTYTFFNGKRLKIIKAGLADPYINFHKNGEFFLTSNKKLAVKCRQGALILEIVQPEGKKEMKGEEFWKGVGK